jgi:hypothetical protein
MREYEDAAENTEADLTALVARAYEYDAVCVPCWSVSTGSLFSSYTTV